MKPILLTFIVVFASVADAGSFDKLVNKYSSRYGVDKRIIEAVMFVESSTRKHVTGDDGKSFGLMQIMLQTARDQGFRGTKHQLLFPVYNIKYGTKYLSQCLKWSLGDVCGAIDIYNRGIGNVIKYPYKKQWAKHRHVRKVIDYLKAKGHEDALQNNCNPKGNERKYSL